MAKEYKITAVSYKIKNWTSQYGDMVTYYVKLEGEDDEAIQLNKKQESPTPEEGQTLFGDIVETEFGRRFKSQKKPFTPSGYQKSPQDKEDIARAVAIKAAVDLHNNGFEKVSDVTATADELLAWLKNEPADEEKPTRQWNKVGKPRQEEDEPLEAPEDFNG